MNTSLRSVELEGFKRYRNPARLPLADRPAGLHMVRGQNRRNPDHMGSNGAGKSTLFDAIAWCLWGKTVQERPTTAVRPWGTKKQPRVSVEIWKDGAKHTVQRGPKATQLTIDGKAVGQEEVDALFLPFAVGTQAIFLGQGRPLFFDLPPRDKMQLLSDVLGLERWERRAEAAGERARRLEAQLQEAEGELQGLETAQGHAQAALEEAQKAGERWSAERDEQAALLEEELRGNQVQLSELEQREAEVVVEVERVGLQLSEGGAALEKDRAELRRRERELTDAEHDEKLQIAKRDELLQQQDQMMSEGTCPTCGQEVTQKHLEKHQQKAQARRDKILAQLTKLSKQIKNIQQEVDALDSRIASESERLQALEATERAHQTTLRNLGQSLGTTRAHVSSLTSQLSNAEEEVNPHREAAQAARKRLREIKKDEAELQEEAAKLEASADRAKFWKQGFRDIRLLIVDDLLADLEETTAAMLDVLGMGDWEVAYVTERETKAGTKQRALQVLVVSPDSGGEARSWEDWSGGEGQRLRLAGALALSEVLLSHAGLQVDVRVLDEPTRSLSPEGVRDLCELLSDYAEEADLRMFYVDHMSMEGTQFASVTTVVNDESGARIQT